MTTIDQFGPWPLIPIIYGGIVYSVRRWRPLWWARLTVWPSPEHPLSHALQSLFAVLVGAITGAATTQDIGGAMIGGAVNLFAPIGHHVMKSAPVPYRGALRIAGKIAAEKWAAAERARKASASLIVLLAFGCASAPPVNTAREACYLQARLAFHQRAADCGTEACIDAETEHQRVDQEACP